MEGLVDIRQLEETYQYFKTEIPRSKKLLAEGLQQYNDMCEGTTKVQMHKELCIFNQRIKDSEKSFENIKRIRLEMYN